MLGEGKFWSEWMDGWVREGAHMAFRCVGTRLIFFGYGVCFGVGL